MTGIAVPSVFLLLLAIASACLITNCPRGGKRNGARPPPRGTTEELPFCTPCGPVERGGLCFGPTMCCSPLGGCEVGGPHATACLGVQDVPPLCRIPPQNPAPSEMTSRCGAGVCTANGLCCTSDWCRADERCLTSTEPSPNVNLVISDHHLSPNLRQGSEQADFNEWNPTDNSDRSAPQYHI